MTYNVIASGSKGNAVIINHQILIDCGVPFKRLAGVFRGLKLVLLTHKHADHFNKTTVRRLAMERPTLRFGACNWLVDMLIECGVERKNIDVYEPNWRYAYGDCTVNPVMLVHDVPNVGYKLNVSNELLFYATDTANLDGIEARSYDVYLVEANHGLEEIEQRIYSKKKAGEFAYEYRAKRFHLSREAAAEFLSLNMRADSECVYLHEHDSVS